ncbi:MAG: hypothetical protein IKZ04_01685 [Spirochaetaceae bacterium]|nr:hypothetical protein [Spirochaetaceae bacterium]
MKKFFFCILFAMICISMIFGMAKKDKSETEYTQIKVTGLVKIYGNEPHIFVGFTALDGTEYSLVANKTELKKLKKMQGILLEISGNLASVSESKGLGLYQLKGGTIYVKSFAAKDQN